MCVNEIEVVNFQSWLRPYMCFEAGYDWGQGYSLLRSAVGKTYDLRSDLWWTKVLAEHQKSTISTLAVKLSVSAIIYPRWTATQSNDSLHDFCIWTFYTWPNVLMNEMFKWHMIWEWTCDGLCRLQMLSGFGWNIKNSFNCKPGPLSDTLQAGAWLIPPFQKWLDHMDKFIIC